MKLHDEWIFPIKQAIILLPVILFSGMSSGFPSVIYTDSSSQYLADK